MPTVVGVFNDRSESESVVDQVVGHGIDRQGIGVVWRERTVHKVEEIEVVTYVDHFEGPAAEAGKGALGGLVGGATAGAGSVLLASAGIVLGPEIAALLGTGTLVATAAAAAAGAAGGSITGGAIGALLGAADHDATKVKTTATDHRDAVERDGFVATIEVDEDGVDAAVAALQATGASEVSVLAGAVAQLRSVLD